MNKLDLELSKICFGTLTTSSLQQNFSPEDAAQLFLYGFQKGICFFDTAELYDNYAALKLFLRQVPRKQVIISTKSYAYDKKTAQISLEKALNEMDTEYIDIFMLHEQESIHTIRGHYDAITFFMDAKKKGYIKKFGISTHHIAGVEAALQTKEIEVLHPIVNLRGIGLQGGNNEKLFPLLRQIKDKNKIVFAMKPFGGGHLATRNQEALSFVLQLPFVDSIAIGMQRKEEIDANVEFIMEGKTSMMEKTGMTNRSPHIADWCIGCGNCVKKCDQNALSLKNNKAVADFTKCIFCGYCASVCPEFCIKVY